MEKYTAVHTVTTFECDENQEMHLRCLFNLLEEMATEHAENLGVGYEAMKEKGGFWVFSAHEIDIIRMPRYRERLIFKTWPSDATAVKAFREIQVLDERENPLVNVSCLFVVVDSVKMRPAPLKRFFTAEPLRERVVDTLFPAIEKPENAEMSKKWQVRCDDIDLNRHVNNSVYIVWAQDVLPSEFRKNHQLKKVRVAFKKSAMLGDEIVSDAVIQDDKSFHLIKSADNGQEMALVEMTWIKKQDV